MTGRPPVRQLESLLQEPEEMLEAAKALPQELAPEMEKARWPVPAPEQATATSRRAPAEGERCRRSKSRAEWNLG